MNFIPKDKRTFLPHNVKKHIELKERVKKYRSRVKIILFSCFFLISSLVFFPGVFSKVAPLSTPLLALNNDGSKVPEFSVKSINQKDAETILQHTVDGKGKLVEIIVSSDVTEKNISNADDRTLKLYNYLKSRGSPMTASAGTFVRVADEKGIDYRLLPAIAGTESGFGKVIPILDNGKLSYNPFGYGIYAGNKKGFDSWDDAITQVAKGIVKSYGVENLKPSIMEKTYTPPSYYGDHHWLRTVTEFMSEF